MAASVKSTDEYETQSSSRCAQPAGIPDLSLSESMRGYLVCGEHDIKTREWGMEGLDI